jgi:hypothetical protein|tara:strand:- start:233 stop:337 length:105 start_codon:yes stop_codon:yes gene_type:complete
MNLDTLIVAYLVIASTVIVVAVVLELSNFIKGKN